MAKKKPATSAKPKVAPKKPAAKKKPAPDWIAELRTGAPGVKKWNKLTGAERAKVKLAGADLSGADLTGVNFAGVAADGASFAGCALANARLCGTTSGGSFNGASFVGAGLANARLTGVGFDEANFERAVLTGADLSGSHFRKASFAGADLAGAKVAGISLLGADLTGTTLVDVQWDGGWFDKSTKWPAGFTIPPELAWHGQGSDPRLVGKGKNAAANDINGLMTRLHANIDEKRMKRTLDMLKKERNQIFSEIEPTMVRGIVRSQRDIDTVYSCVLTEDGTYSCGTPNMEQCMGLSNEPCKHLLVLLIGLTRAGQLDPATADKWVVAANQKNPRWNKTVQNHIAGSFLKYKGAQAGEIDWRPTETIPEDFYAM